MKNVLLSACAAIMLTLGATAASADDNRYRDNGRYYDNGYYYDNVGNSWRYQNQDYGNYQNQDYGNYDGYDNDGYGYRYDIVSPRSIVRDLQRRGFTNISQPALAGKLYQVKARDPSGHKTKLYIDAYSGRIVKMKG